MSKILNLYLRQLFTLVTLLACAAPAMGQKVASPSPILPSWKEGPSRTAILEFVSRVTDPKSADFVPLAERIATFDNDGTLWSEKPLYFQLAFAMDRVKSLADQHPEWKSQQPFQGILEDDLEAVADAGLPGLLKILGATHGGMTTAEFQEIAARWLDTAKHPKTGRRYTEMTFQPMLELLDYLRAHGFKTYIVSGGGVDFLRVFSESAYGIPPEQVIGSRVKTQLEYREGKPVILRQPEIGFVDDKEGKPIAIGQQIGRRPIIAVGNSDGDLQMLQWTSAGAGARLGILIRHTDAQREWAYDRESPIGKLDKALDEAPQRGWIVVDMQNEWQTIYPDLK